VAVFLAALLCAVIPPDAPTNAQQVREIAKVGLLVPSTQAGASHFVDAFRQGLRELGHVEGRTVVVEARYGEGKSERLPELARELVRLKADVIVASTDAAISAAKRETRTIPIVMVFGADPVGSGFVTSLPRPGGNVTGLSSLAPDLSGKRLEILKELVPGLSRVAIIWNPDVRGAVLEYKETEVAATSLQLKLQSVEVFSVDDLDRVSSAPSLQGAQALILISGTPAATSKRAAIPSLAQRNRLPAIYAIREYVDAGGLMSYGPNVADMFRRAAAYVDKILKGAPPAEVPVERPRKFELVINLRVAKALRLTIPPSLLSRADHVIP
jgi:putative ABC transport system substrate-binding protein